MATSTQKTRRQRAILAILREQSLGSQTALSRVLARRGFSVTQATLSRDLRDLRVVRVPTADGLRYRPSAAVESDSKSSDAELRSLRSQAELEVIAVDGNESSVVVRTLAGRAPGVAVSLDSLELPDALGTIAGDDTILVLPRSVKRTARLRRHLAALLGLD